MDQQFEQLADRYIREFPALSPVAATRLGDHRFDSQLDAVNEQARADEAAFYRRYLEDLRQIDGDRLSRAHQVDHALLAHELRGALWRLEELREWSWNPLRYTGVSGEAIYALMAREFAPLDERLESVRARLEQFPRFFREVCATLQPALVPRIHAQTAIKQNRGVLSIMNDMVRPHLASLAPDQRERLERAMKSAGEAVAAHQQWLEKELLPHAEGDFRLGAQRYDKKLAFTLHTPLTREEIRTRAEQELRRVRDEMYALAQQVYRQKYPLTTFPSQPSRFYQQAIIRAALELAYQEKPAADGVVAAARESLALAIAFVRKHDLVTIPPDPLEIIIMPAFKRGVSLAYCDSPGPLDVGQKTFYAVTPPPDDWDDQKTDSFLREYNTRSVHNLTIHEAMPGHFLQLAHANRYPGRLRAILSSGTFIEGWAVYAEQMMADQGFLDGDPLMRLITLKWYLRGIANALVDQAIHVDGMTRQEAMRLMMEDTFQEEHEAAAKWVRAQLTSVQLSTYFVGYQEHADLRHQAEEAWGEDFDLKTYHDRVISFGSPPVKFVQTLLLERPTR